MLMTRSSNVLRLRLTQFKVGEEEIMVAALIGTRTGVYHLQEEGLHPLGLTDHHISAVYAHSSGDGKRVLLVGTYGDGLFRSEDGGEMWLPVADGPTAIALRTIRPDPFEPASILCGGEPARISRSTDGGASWHEYKAIPQLPGSDEWFLPYSPRAGAVRNIYSPPGTSRLLASVEVGGLLDSTDQGESWSIGRVTGDTDIHFVTGHPDDPDLLFAALGWASLKSVKRTEQSPRLGGVARSRDGGQTWQKLHLRYTRAVIVPSTRPDLLLAGPAERVGESGRIEVSADYGDTWVPAGQGIDSPMDDMVEEFLPAPDGSIWATCSGGRLLRAEPGAWQWTTVLPSGAHLQVRSVAFLSGHT